MRTAKLIMVTGENNNKYYDMEESGDSILVTYGRVGVTSQKTKYPSSKWGSLLKSKIKKGYRDVTELRLEKTSIDFASITEDEIQNIVDELQRLANKSVAANYTVSSEAVTQLQVDQAQKIIDDLVKQSRKRKKDLEKFNQSLISLFQVIPRRMKKVQDHLCTESSQIQDILENEQNTLDVMRGQVRVNSAKSDNTAETSKTILDAMGLEFSVVSAADLKIIRKELGSLSGKLKRAFKIVNKRTQKAFDGFISSRPDKTTRMFWHGSRNENWWSIIDTGLVLRPNAVITGKMFGYGLYFADKAEKSIGYTSCRGSYWAKGSSNKGFMSLYEVHTGNSLVKKQHRPWMYELTESKLKEYADYDSFTALGGADLRNNEFIVYNQNQCTIKYLVEIA